ncbi:MAG: carboxypeptidase-like regulatory domain-containing protein, partial [candidate division WOR-3 bacterium]
MRSGAAKFNRCSLALHFLHSLLRQVGPCLALSLTGLGCNAPRDNPLDPGLGGNIEGRVLTRSALPIHNAYLELLEAGRLARSDSSGRFGLYNLPVGTFLLRCSADSFAPDSSDVVLAKGRIDTLTLELDGLPFFRFAQLRRRHEHALQVEGRRIPAAQQP